MKEIKTIKYFDRKFTKLTKKNSNLKSRILTIIKILQLDPYNPKLKTHKVTTKHFGVVYSSSVTGDIRLIWKEENNSIIIVLLDLGGHSGNNRVY